MTFPAFDPRARRNTFSGILTDLGRLRGLAPDSQVAHVASAQLGRPPGQLAPSRIPAVPRSGIVQAPAYVAKPTGAATQEQKHLVARGDVEAEVHGDDTFVRVYQTVFAPAEGSSTYKDVQQNPRDKKVVFKGSGDFWLNAGRPWRAFHYVRTYRGQGVRNRAKERKSGTSRDQGQPIIRSFLIPYETYLQLTGEAIAESQKSELGEEYNLNTDTNKDTDQYLIRQENRKLLLDNALPESLISYVIDDNISEYQGTGQEHHGEVRPMSMLANQLGIPNVVSDRFILPVVTKADESIEIAKATDQAERADKLARLYDLSFLLELWPWQRRLSQVKELSKLSAEFQVSWPRDFGARQKLRSEIAAAATYSLMPSITQANYEQAAGKALGHQQAKSGEEFDPFTQRQKFPEVELEKKERPKAAPPTDEEIEKAKEAKARKKADTTGMKSLDEEENLLGGIFG